ncbi:hypothetical protein D9C73_028179 [Collichthys lucidus]|uniref:Uncharacterized protein n=1 Tax=Collichthys lucidus TaxID=240159 RepID=A0A4U5TWC5_COLLU|nr:hypothetical protein D9C73_028179 [Collichthys lucidus]
MVTPIPPPPPSPPAPPAGFSGNSFRIRISPSACGPATTQQSGSSPGPVRVRPGAPHTQAVTLGPCPRSWSERSGQSQRQAPGE